MNSRLRIHHLLDWNCGQPIAVGTTCLALKRRSLPIFFAVREAAIGPSRHSPQCSIIPALGVIAAMEGGAAAWCQNCRRATHAGLSTRHNRGTPAHDPAALPMGYDGLAQVVVAYGLLAIAHGPWAAQGCASCPALGLAATAPERAAAAAGARAAAQAGRSIDVRSTAIPALRSPRRQLVLGLRCVVPGISADAQYPRPACPAAGCDRGALEAVTSDDAPPLPANPRDRSHDLPFRMKYSRPSTGMNSKRNSSAASVAKVARLRFPASSISPKA